MSEFTCHFTLAFSSQDEYCFCRRLVYPSSDVLKPHSGYRQRLLKWLVAPVFQVLTELFQAMGVSICSLTMFRPQGHTDSKC